MNKLPLIKPFINTNVFDNLFISSIADDSRDVKENSLFIARQGVGSHGNEFVRDAIHKGASCIITDKKIDEELDIPIYCFHNLEHRILEILYSFYDLSEDDFIFHGVTGTNGKTTTAFMAHNIIRALKRPSVYIGTLGAIINDDHLETKENTTPGIFEIFQILQDCKFQQKTSIFIEISSHALAQKRIGNIFFLQTVLLNIQSDHLDYHKTEADYINAKLSITELNKKNPTIILIDKIQDLHKNFSDDQKKQLSKSQFLSANNDSAAFKYSIEYNPDGRSKLTLNFPDFCLDTQVSLFLKFNIDNYVAAIALISNQISKDELKSIEGNIIKLPKGRGEILRLKEGKILIDFAHDHQSIENILSEIANYHDEIILVFGCGGDRDRSKRSKMMKVAQDFASKVFFTSDNNRYESFASIASDAMVGNSHTGIEILEDRHEAIDLALQCLNKENILVILGKGHETYMDVSGKKIPFNDKDCVLEILGHEAH